VEFTLVRIEQTIAVGIGMIDFLPTTIRALNRKATVAQSKVTDLAVTLIDIILFGPSITRLD